MSNVTGFEYNYHQSGTLTLTGAGNPLLGWNVTSGASLILDGTINSANTFAISSNGNTSGTDIEILSGSSITGWDGVFFNGVPNATFNNAGSITVTGGPALQTNGPTVMTNSGTLASSGSNAVFTGVGNATLTNSGMVLGGSSSFGVNAYYSANINNQAGGTISGGAGGIRSGSGGSGTGGMLNIANAYDASITGDTAIAAMNLASINLNNSGNVVGNVTGISATGTGYVSIVNNGSGIIGTGTVNAGAYTFGGTGDAIDLAVGTITNNGLIEGAASGVSATGNLQLTNSGDILGHGANGVTVWGTANILNNGYISSDVGSAILGQYRNGHQYGFRPFDEQRHQHSGRVQYRRHLQQLWQGIRRPRDRRQHHQPAFGLDHRKYHAGRRQRYAGDLQWPRHKQSFAR